MSWSLTKTDTVSWTVHSGKQIVLPTKGTILYVSSVCVDQRKLFAWFRLSVMKFLFVYVQISLVNGLRGRYVRSCRLYDRYCKMRRIISPWENNNCPYFTRRWGNRHKCMLNVDLAVWTCKSDVKCSVLCPIHNVQMEIFILARFWVSHCGATEHLRSVIKPIGSFETSVNIYQSARRNSPEDFNLYTYSCLFKSP